MTPKESFLKLFSFFLIMFHFLMSPCLAGSNDQGLYSFSFKSTPLEEVLFTISDITGASFIFSDSINSYSSINWVQRGILKQNLLNTLFAILSGTGLYVDDLDNGLYVIRNTATINTFAKGIGIYPVGSSDSQQVANSLISLYGESAGITFFQDNVIVTGTSDFLKTCHSIIKKITFKESQIESYVLKNIPVKMAIQSLTDTKMIDLGSFYPDYWQRAIVIRGSTDVRNTVKEILQTIDKPILDSIDRLEYFYTVNGEALKTLLESAVPDLIVNVIGTDKILLTGLIPQVEKASCLIHEIDGTAYQVKVEAVIAYLTDSQYDELGVKLSTTSTNLIFELNDILPTTLLTQNSGVLLKWFNNSFGLTACAQKGNSKGRIIQSPVLTVASGQDGIITVGQNVPIITKANIDKNDGETTGTDISRQDVGVTFQITPKVESNGQFVRLKVVQEVSSVSSESQVQQNAVDIVTDQQRIESTILVANGGVIFLGGNQTEETASAKTYIPILGHLLGWIPGIGQIFTYESETHENFHLIVSLRVTVLDRNV